MAHIENIQNQLAAFKKKYFLNQLIKSSAWFVLIFIGVYLFSSGIEYLFWFNSLLRTILFGTFSAVVIYYLITLVLIPYSKFSNPNKYLSDEEASKIIGNFFPEIDDKLLNTLQLNNHSENEFIIASISQKISKIQVFDFSKAVDLSPNFKVLKWLSGLIFLLILATVFWPSFFIESPQRILLFNKNFPKPAPFEFILQNKNLSVYKNDPFEIKVKLQGNALPEQVYLIHNNQKIKLLKEGGIFKHTFPQVVTNEEFHFESVGVESVPYQLNVIEKPNLEKFTVQITYPSYIGKKTESFENLGSFTVPEGTKINWSFETQATDELNIYCNDENKVNATNGNKPNFVFEKLVQKSFDYEILLKSKMDIKNDQIKYTITSIPDQYPQIEASNYTDSSLYKTIMIAGNISDDYGFTKLILNYKVGKKPFQKISIPIKKNQNNQSFFYQWNIDSLTSESNTELNYFVQVWDNDGFHGPKSSKSQNFELKIPKAKELEKNIAESTNKAENLMDKALSEAKELQQSVKKLEEKLKGKKQLTFDDKKQYQELLEKKEKLLEKLQKAQNQTNNSLEKMEKFDPKVSQEIKEKSDELQKLMNELLDEKTKEMLKDLQKMMAEKAQDQKVKEAIEDFKKNQEDLAKDLEKTLERFRQLHFENKLNKSVEELKQLAENQKNISENNNKTEQQKAQEELNKKFEDTKKTLDELEKSNQELENKHNLENLEQQKQDISQKLQESSQKLQQNQSQKAKKSQQEAQDKMNSLANQLSQMQKQEAEENLTDMRKLLENLLNLSFEQENLMKNFKNVNLNDPRYVQLSRAQLKLANDSKIVEDSLIALSKRVFQIKQFVTKELGLMKEYMEEASNFIKAKKPYEAASKQQFAMTSMNNLALMLSDVVKQMQEQMAQKSKPGAGTCSKPGGKNPKPGLSEMQKSLNQQMQQMGKAGKSGQKMSEEMAKMAAKQELIRNALSELEKKLNEEGGKKGGGSMKKLMEAMEKTEEDILNNNITQQTIERQKEILTRLLEVEKSDREQDMEQKREAQTAQQFKQEIPEILKKYLEKKQQQVELLKTASPCFSPFYKQEIGEYFKKLEN